MAIVGYEALAVVGVLLIIFLWGPQKLPEMARSIGKAKMEFDKAYKEATSLADPSSFLKPQPGTPTVAQAPQAAQPPQDPILIAARSLGISTEGKTKEELARAIAEKSVGPSQQPTEKADAGSAQKL